MGKKLTQRLGSPVGTIFLFNVFFTSVTLALAMGLALF